MKNRKEKTNKQIYTKLAVLAVGGMVTGFLFGFGGAFFANHFEGDMLGGLRQIMTVVIPVIYVLLTIAVYSYSFWNYGKAKKLVADWDGWNEDIIDEAEKKLSRAMEPANIMTVCNFFLYSAMVYISQLRADIIKTPTFKDTFKEGIPFLIAGVVLFLINMIIIMILQKLTIDCFKKLNPEKRGNVFDTEFHKDWLASCDEAQKEAVFEAGYRAFRATNNACLVLWLITLVSMLMFDIGILPSVCIFVIWMTLILSYTIAGHKLEKKK